MLHFSINLLELAENIQIQQVPLHVCKMIYIMHGHDVLRHVTGQELWLCYK
jgi:hypothetical protein